MSSLNQLYFMFEAAFWMSELTSSVIESTDRVFKFGWITQLLEIWQKNVHQCKYCRNSWKHWHNLRILRNVSLICIFPGKPAASNDLYWRISWNMEIARKREISMVDCWGEYIDRGPIITTTLYYNCNTRFSTKLKIVE